MTIPGNFNDPDIMLGDSSNLIMINTGVTGYTYIDPERELDLAEIRSQSINQIRAFTEQELQESVGGRQIEIPKEAWYTVEQCHNQIETNCASTPPTQDEIDTYLGNLPPAVVYLLCTDTYCSSTAKDSQVKIEVFYTGTRLVTEDLFNGDTVRTTVNIYKPPSGYSISDISDRNIYKVDADAIAAAAQVDLDVTFLGNAFQELSADWDQFEIEPVLRAGFLPAIRPGQYGGLTLHPDRHATIRVLDINGNLKYSTTNFMLESVAMATKESFSVSSAFTGNTLQFSEEKFKIFKLSLRLIDAEYPFDWRRAWDRNWRKYMRGSQLVKDKSRFYILYGSSLIGGYPLQYTFSASANDEPYSALSVDIFVTDNIPLPEMKYIASEKEGEQVGFKWTGTEYSTEDMDAAIQSLEAREYYSPPLKPTSPKKAETPLETEYESKE